MSGWWPALPRTALGYEVPQRFRRFGVRFADADRVLVDFVAWLESTHPEPKPHRLIAPSRPDRDRLVEGFIVLRDRIHSEALSAMVLRALADVGVHEVSADNERFDPVRHCAVGTRPTDDPALHDVVAETEACGYRDGDRLVRLPEVVVFRHETGGTP